jgi:hypothetical protein
LLTGDEALAWFTDVLTVQASGKWSQETIGRALVLLAQCQQVEEREGWQDDRVFPDASREESLAYAQAPLRLLVARELAAKHG